MKNSFFAVLGLVFMSAGSAYAISGQDQITYTPDGYIVSIGKSAPTAAAQAKPSVQSNSTDSLSQNLSPAAGERASFTRR